jgi:hypothetical protein
VELPGPRRAATLSVMMVPVTALLLAAPVPRALLSLPQGPGATPAAGGMPAAALSRGRTPA